METEMRYFILHYHFLLAQLLDLLIITGVLDSEMPRL